MNNLNPNKPDDSLLSESFDLTVVGVILTTIIMLVERKITGQNVIIICSFLACTYLWKLIWPLQTWTRRRAGQIFCILMIVVFSWWLTYAAENTRTGWYRVNVLQKRVEALIRQAPAYIIAADADGSITETSENIKLLTGYSPEELKGQQLTILMRDGPSARHQIAYDKAVAEMQRDKKEDNGWMMQGLVVVGIKHKDGHIVPVKAYAGGIRWSTDIQFKGDLDMFAVLIPATLTEANQSNSTVKMNSFDQIIEAPSPPPVPTIVPIPSSVPLPKPPAKPNE